MTSAFAGLRAVTAHLEVITERIASGEGSLGRMVSDDTFYDEARETMAGLRASAASVDEVATQMRSGQGTLGRLLTDDTLYRETADAVRALGRTAESIEDQAPISIMGTAVGTLF
jgi:phospholipid/cholesterol/gamma-HCH transport system substrate-binding protein